MRKMYAAPFFNRMIRSESRWKLIESSLFRWMNELCKLFSFPWAHTIVYTSTFCLDVCFDWAWLIWFVGWHCFATKLTTYSMKFLPQNRTHAHMKSHTLQLDKNSLWFRDSCQMYVRMIGKIIDIWKRVLWLMTRWSNLIYRLCVLSKRPHQTRRTKAKNKHVANQASLR